MCGIAGLLTPPFDNEAADMERIAAMVEAQSHRGPDDAGIELVSANPRVILGHRRLAIIDTSPAGHQPMHDHATGTWITFNGEIYNFRELRSELTAAGHEFATRTDTEVILKSYAQWGPKCIERLRGIFAFGIWDPRTRTLILARDQLGVKPLYFAQLGDAVVFASEVRAVLASGLVPRQLDRGALHGFMAFGSVQEPTTLIARVRSLPPGHWMTIHDGEARTERYWRVPMAGDAIVSDDAIRAALEDSAVAQLVSDVPIGAFLSGGIDSTAVSALMQRAASSPVRTLSVIFEEAGYDERHFARLASERIGTSHAEILLTGEAAARSLATALDAFDQPSMDGLNTFIVSRAAREAGLTVALSGLGGDEVFVGYSGFARSLRVLHLARRLSILPRPVRRGAGLALSRVARSEWQRRGAELLTGDRQPYAISRLVFGRRQVADLVSPEFHAAADESDARFTELEAEAASRDPVNGIAAMELQTYMVSTLLRDTDQMSMASSLEVRVPLLDHRLVELLFRIPGTHKIDQHTPKVLLTRPLSALIPPENVYRAKRGFELPIAKWLRGTLQDQVRDSFLGSDSATPFHRPALEALWGDFTEGRMSWSRVWGIFVLRHWLARHRIAA